jgi:ribosome-binding protein aMBF1 (putative translation factor)
VPHPETRICDVCNKEIKGKPAASRHGRWGLDLCHACWQRLRKRQLARQAEPPTLEQRAEAAQQDGPPYVWPACELCGGDVDAHGLGYYTTKGKPRRFCSDWCRATRNSRVGAPIRAHKARQRVKAGTWQNPAEYHTPESLRAAALAGGEVRARQHRAALEAGTWQNPADAPGARAKLSRPRVHGNNPALHRAIEKLDQGYKVADLEPEEAEAHQTHRRALRTADPERFQRYSREAYRRRMATEEGRAKQRARWRAQRDRRKQQPPNEILKAAREKAGLSQAALANLVGISQTAVSQWERFSAVPQSAEVQSAVAEALGCWPWPERDLP